jgi:hypothetical protein
LKVVDGGRESSLSEGRDARLDEAPGCLEYGGVGVPGRDDWNLQLGTFAHRRGLRGRCDRRRRLVPGQTHDGEFVTDQVKIPESEGDPTLSTARHSR